MSFDVPQGNALVKWISLESYWNFLVLMLFVFEKATFFFINYLNNVNYCCFLNNKMIIIMAHFFAVIL